MWVSGNAYVTRFTSYEVYGRKRKCALMGKFQGLCVASAQAIANIHLILSHLQDNHT